MADLKPVVNEVWMRIQGSESMYLVGHLVCTPTGDGTPGPLTLEGFNDSLTGFIAAVNEVMGTRAG